VNFAENKFWVIDGQIVDIGKEEHYHWIDDKPELQEQFPIGASWLSYNTYFAKGWIRGYAFKNGVILHHPKLSIPNIKANVIKVMEFYPHYYEDGVDKLSVDVDYNDDDTWDADVTYSGTSLFNSQSTLGAEREEFWEASSADSWISRIHRDMGVSAKMRDRRRRIRAVKLKKIANLSIMNGVEEDIVFPVKISLLKLDGDWQADINFMASEENDAFIHQLKANGPNDSHIMITIDTKVPSKLNYILGKGQFNVNIQGRLFAKHVSRITWQTEQGSNPVFELPPEEQRLPIVRKNKGLLSELDETINVTSQKQVIEYLTRLMSKIQATNAFLQRIDSIDSETKGKHSYTSTPEDRMGDQHPSLWQPISNREQYTKPGNVLKEFGQKRDTEFRWARWDWEYFWKDSDGFHRDLLAMIEHIERWVVKSDVP